MSKAKLSLKERINSDLGLKSTRRTLTTVSIILIALIFTGAKVEEANTFILKIAFSQGELLNPLIFLSTIFLTIRYYSYAYIYHRELTQMWKDSFLRDKNIFLIDHYNDSTSGIISTMAPKGFDIYHNDISHWSYTYRTKYFFFKYFVFDKFDNQAGEVVDSKKVNVFNYGIVCYFTVLKTEFKHRAIGFFKNPENLDIYTPYFLSTIVIVSIFYKDKISSVLSFLA